MMEDNIYQILLEKSGQGIILRQDEKYVLVNQSFSEMVGYTVDELLAFSGEQIVDLVHPEDRPAMLERRRAREAGEEVPGKVEYRFIHKSGKTGWWSAVITVVDYNGKPAILGLYEDVTEQNLIVESAARGRQLLVSVLDALPVGVCLSDETGHFRMMNDAFCAVYEYDRNEMLGKHFNVIMPSEQIEESKEQYARMLEGDVVSMPVERKRMRKDGSIIYIEAANALVTGEDGQRMVITTVRDITERIWRSQILQMRLRLTEFAEGHSLKELMQQALDEIEVFTESSIGFYHFVDEDQNKIWLQAWSTRTRAEFCEADVQDGHYSVDEAGVWTDCIKTKEPVIHNDYASLPHRKGMPEGHTEVVRELVVPTLRDDKVVAILGVGNKLSNYVQQDADTLDYITDLIWAIIEKKRSDEYILKLNAQLERLAMIDELTDLPNRRAFFAQGEKEIKRLQRYNTSFSLLILDLDSFKKVNDTYGHDAGDLVLKNFASVLRRNIRGTDLAARLGGEEFGVLLPNTPLKEAMNLAERIRASVESAVCMAEEQEIKITVSIGAATYSHERDDLGTMIKYADAAMYHAKNQGGNRIANFNGAIGRAAVAS